MWPKFPLISCILRGKSRNKLPSSNYAVLPWYKSKHKCHEISVDLNVTFSWSDIYLAAVYPLYACRAPMKLFKSICSCLLDISIEDKDLELLNPPLCWNHRSYCSLILVNFKENTWVSYVFLSSSETDIRTISL